MNSCTHCWGRGKINVEVKRHCKKCHGERTVPDSWHVSGRSQCNACYGKGIEEWREDQECSHCHGSGKPPGPILNILPRFNTNYEPVVLTREDAEKFGKFMVIVAVLGVLLYGGFKLKTHWDEAAEAEVAIPVISEETKSSQDHIAKQLTGMWVGETGVALNIRPDGYYLVEKSGVGFMVPVTYYGTKKKILVMDAATSKQLLLEVNLVDRNTIEIVERNNRGAHREGRLQKVSPGEFLAKVKPAVMDQVALHVKMGGAGKPMRPELEDSLRELKKWETLLDKEKESLGTAKQSFNPNDYLADPKEDVADKVATTPGK